MTTHPARLDAPRVLAARGVGHQYHPTWWCLSDIELDLEPGQFVGIVGPNGSGKSTLLRILAGQLRPSAGAVELDGRPLGDFGRRELARRIGFLPQEVLSSFAFTVEEVIAQGRYPHGSALSLVTAEDRRVIGRVMDWTTTRAFAHRPFGELSGGERQRVLLASVLAQEAAFILLDEPTAALDIQHQVDVFELVRRLAGEGLGVGMVTHDLNQAARYCDRMVLLFEGRIERDGPPAEVMDPDTLRRVYQTELMVEPNPVTGTPMVVILGRAEGRP